MNPTDHPDDSPWNDLAAELGLDAPAPKPPPAPSASDDEFALDDADLMAGDAADDTVIIPALNSEPLAEDGEQPGQGEKKRRRRRRRRRKTGADGAEAGEAGETVEASDGEDADTDADEPEMVEVAAEVEHDAGGAMPAGELFANWSVPSWDEIVAGLYRPER